MAGLIKGQILKHLSKFAKNLSPNSINLSTLRGEGELRDLELNDEVLTDVLDLPTWLKLSKATCNRVSIKIQWTKLKSQPICLYLDEVTVYVETCDEPRKPTGDSPISGYSGTAGKYGLAEMIIDGMYVNINSVIVNFNAKTFVASIQLSRIIIESKTPTWHTTESLRHTRLKDDRRGEILIFKEAEWMTLRIEANALEGSEPNLATTPLRLIANQSKIRITIKKRLLDCGVIASRLHINLDDLLWVLTDSQLKAALVFLNSLKDVIQKSAKQSKKMAAEKLKRQSYTPSPAHLPPGSKANNQQKPGSKSQQTAAKVFTKFDIKETSYHLYTGRIDLHLCDDAAPAVPENTAPNYVDGEDPDHRRKVEGGAMQVTLFKMALDSYPYHPAGTDRTHWLKYDKNMERRDVWADGLLATFKDDVRRVREAFITPKSSPAHVPTSGQGQGQAEVNKGHSNGFHEPQQIPPQTQGQGRPTSLPNHAPMGPGQGQGQGPAQGQGHPQGPQPQAVRPTKLLESSMVFRLEDFALYRVSTALDHKRSIPKKFMTSDKQRLFLPAEMSCIHAEYTDYYFPEGIDYPAPLPSGKPPRTSPPKSYSTVSNPDDEFVVIDDDDSFLTSFVPHSNIYILVNPIFLKVDFLTILWLNAFVLNLVKKANIPDSEGPKIHTDIKLEALMPRIILPADSPVPGQSDRPEGLQIQASQITVTNIRDKASKLLLLRNLDEFNRGRLFKDSFNAFPRDKEDLLCVPPNFSKHLDLEDSPYFDKSVESVMRGMGVPGDKQRATNELLNPLKRSQSTTGLTYYNMMTDSFKLDSTKDVWCVFLDQFWLEFVGVPSSRNRPVPFIESFPLTLWISQPLQSLQSQSSVCVLSQSDSSLSSSASEGSVGPAGDTEVPRSRSRQRLKEFYKEDMASHPDFKLTAIRDDQSVPTKKTETELSSSRLGDIHIITHASAKVSVQLNHFQYLFLMRLVDAVTKYQDEMEDDTIFITKQPLPEKKLSLSVIVKEVEVALICPPIPEIPSLQMTPDDAEDIFAADDRGKGSVGSQFTGDHQGGDRGDSALGASLHSSRSHEHTNGPLVHKSSSEVDVFSDTTNDMYPDITENHINDLAPQIHVSDSGGTVTIPTESGSRSRSRSGSPSSRASPSHDGGPKGQHQSTPKHGDMARRDSDIKKSFNAMANFTKGMAKKINKTVTNSVKVRNQESEDGLSVSDELETMSMRSGSSDEEDYIMSKFTSQTEAPAFESKFTLSDDTSIMDSGSEFRDSEGASVQGLGGLLDRAQGVVSVVCFKIHNSEAAISIKGKDIAVAASVDHMIPEEHGNVNLDKFHDRFINVAKENKSFSVESLPRLADSPVRIRFVKGPAAEKLTPTAGEKGYLRAVISEFHSKFLTSTLSSLGDLFDDEVSPTVTPMFIRVENTSVMIKDNKPPIHEINPPTKDPIELFVKKVIVRRKEDGQFNITVDEPGETPVSSGEQQRRLEETMSADIAALRVQISELEADIAHREQEQIKHDLTKAEVTKLRQENDQLQRHLEKIGKMSTASGGFNIEALQAEMDKWRERAKERKHLQKQYDDLCKEFQGQTEEVLTLKQERESLLATIGFLQEELNQSEQLRFRPGQHH